MPGIGSYQVTIEPNARSWSSGYDRRLPSDGPGFNSRRTHVFSLALSRSLSLSLALSRTHSRTHSRTSSRKEKRKTILATGVEPVT